MLKKKIGRSSMTWVLSKLPAYMNLDQTEIFNKQNLKSTQAIHTANSLNTFCFET